MVTFVRIHERGVGSTASLIAGRSPAEVLMLAGNRLTADCAQLLDALDQDLTAEHRFVLHEVIAHIEEVELRIERFDQYLLEQLAPYRSTLALMQTIPGIATPLARPCCWAKSAMT